MPARLKEIKSNKDSKDEKLVLEKYLSIQENLETLNEDIKEKEKQLDEKAYKKYPSLSVKEIKVLVVQDKWMHVIEKDVHSEMERISQKLSQRLIELAERYEYPLPELDKHVLELEKKVNKHLKKMGASL
jgi:type I restriction enzyme M protein